MRKAGLIADVSLTLINRTGAYHVCCDIVEGLPQYFTVRRYWRLTLEREPPWPLRKVLGRAMLLELDHLEIARQWFGVRRRPTPASKTLFFDPLYVLQTQLEARDIVICHDVGPVTHPELYNPATTARYAESYSAIKEKQPGMVFVSEAARREFVRLLGSQFRFLKVIPLYVRSTENSGEIEPAGVTPPFLLTVGALELRKNHCRIIEAFARSGLRERGYSYILCGPRGNSAQDILALANSTPGVRYLGYPSDAEVQWLYRHASGLIMPSLLEGFGLPALEAAQHGLVSVISRDSAQCEAAGGAAIEVDPLSVNGITQGLLQLIDMPSDERAERVSAARRHAAGLNQENFLREWADLLASEQLQ